MPNYVSLLPFALMILSAVCFFWRTIARKSKHRKTWNFYLEYAKSFVDYINTIKEQYIDHSVFEYAKTHWAECYAYFNKHRHRQNDPSISFLCEVYPHLEQSVKDWNEAFIQNEKNRYPGFWNNFEGKKLDAQQQVAVITDELNDLVIAGAGSGKTLTLVAKVYYLVKYRSVKPEEILILAFNRKAAAEITERLTKAGLQIKAQTFHALGLSIISENLGRRPDVADNSVLNKIISHHLCGVSINNTIDATNQLEYFGLYAYPLLDISQFETAGDKYLQEKGFDLETLKSKYLKAVQSDKHSIKGEQMRSVEEVLIANFLFLHGVEYVYEKNYPYPLEDYHRNYHPDFYLVDYDIYLEHFGIDSNGNLPWLSPIEAKKYKEEMAWKRQTHKKNGTKLIESYSYWNCSGRLLEKLDQLLRSNDIKYHKIDAVTIVRALGRNRSMDRLQNETSKVIGSFIRLAKENPSVSLDTICKQIMEKDYPFISEQMMHLLNMSKVIMKEYNEQLLKSDIVDFSDMIAQATSLVKSGAYHRTLKYIIVDEFQDISTGRYQLIKALRDLTKAKTFCVGDDWQSIYRFTGCDVSFLTKFKKYFGYSEIMKVERTYRFSQELIKAVSPFIMANPAQIKKNMVSDKHEPYPVCLMIYKNDKAGALTKTVQSIVQTFGKDKSILFLLRNSFDLGFLESDPLWRLEYDSNGAVCKVKYLPIPELDISVMTIHSAKGSEADNIVIINADNSLLGLPNKIADSPILQLLLSHRDKYEYAEERRLFYVALTRTHNRAYIMVQEDNASSFAREMYGKPYVRAFKYDDVSRSRPVCPVCKRGHLLIRINSETDTEFVGCSLYPACQNRYNDCSILDHVIKCPECQGYMVFRKGAYGDFIGCTNWPLCKHTMRINSI